MPADVQSPLRVYLDHLERGDLAYQFSVAAGRPVFFPRVLCPFTGSDRLEWRVSAGIGTVYATTIHNAPPTLRSRWGKLPGHDTKWSCDSFLRECPVSHPTNGAP